MGPDPDRPVGSHPLVRAAEESATAARLDAGAAKLEYLPRLAALGALWARGSGFVSGSVGPSPDGGLTPDSRNWAVGLVLTWPALGTLGTHARALAANARWEVASARFEEVTQDVQSQIESARVGLEGARRVAANTPVAMSAARTNEQQAVARYKAGLNSVSDVAEAERLLAAAESDDASAHLAVWRALLVLSRSTGDLQPFLAESAEGGR